MDSNQIHSLSGDPSPASSGSDSAAAAPLIQRLLEVSFLPPSFEVIPRLLVLLDDPEVNGEALADLIRVDAGLTAAVVHLANSGYSSRGQRVETVLGAAMRIGLGEVYRIVMKIVASPVLSAAPQPGFARLDLWSHSLSAAAAAQVLQRQIGGGDSEVAFTAALLHDVGKALMAQALGAPYINLLEECKLESKAFYIEEMRAFQIGHAEVGARVLQRWNFPEKIVSAVAAHHHPAEAPGTHAQLAALVYAGNILAYRVASGYRLPDYVIQPDPACLGLIGLDPETLAAYEDEVKQAIDREQMRLG